MDLACALQKTIACRPPPQPSFIAEFGRHTVNEGGVFRKRENGLVANMLGNCPGEVDFLSAPASKVMCKGRQVTYTKRFTGVY